MLMVWLMPLAVLIFTVMVPGLCPLLTVATSMPWKRCM